MRARPRTNRERQRIAAGVRRYWDGVREARREERAALATLATTVAAPDAENRDVVLERHALQRLGSALDRLGAAGAKGVRRGRGAEA
jgi:hypothetical protein